MCYTILLQFYCAQIKFLLKLQSTHKTLGIISIRRYRNIDRQPHIATISCYRLQLWYHMDTTRLILMDGNSMQTSMRKAGECRYVSNRLTA